jgi:hypothetical protein
MLVDILPTPFVSAQQLSEHTVYTQKERERYMHIYIRIKYSWVLLFGQLQLQMLLCITI